MRLVTTVAVAYRVRMAASRPTSLVINGRRHRPTEPDMPLLWYLRDMAGLTGTKYGCGAGQCGACTVHVAGSPVRSCTLPVGQVTGPVTTIEGVSGALATRVIAAWNAVQVAQCGYCQPGQIMTAIALLRADPAPDDDAIDAAMAGNLCRCATYLRIRQAIHRAAA